MIGVLAASVPVGTMAVIPFFAIGVVFAGVIPGNSVGGSRLPAVLGAGPASGVLLIPCFLYSVYSLLSIPDMRKSRALGPLPFGERRESTGAPAVPALRPAEVEAQA